MIGHGFSILFLQVTFPPETVDGVENNPDQDSCEFKIEID